LIFFIFLVQLEPKYYDDLKSNSVILLNVDSMVLCERYCLLNENCVFFVYVSTDDLYDELPRQSCVMKSKIDITNGTYSQYYLNGYSVKSIIHNSDFMASIYLLIIIIR
jgi:hypothetical protein